MSTTWLEGDRSFFLGAAATLIQDDREIASTWASKHVVPNAAYGWLIGRFVESDKPNNNRQVFSLKGLQLGQPTIQHAPMNMNHSDRRVVGAFVASELLYPTATEGDVAEEQASLNPYIESLAVMWKHYFPDEFMVIAKANQEGSLYYSMECKPTHVQCTGEGGCEQTYEYAGRISASYCDHLNKMQSDKYLINPHFTAGAAITPPVRPGWANADVRQLVANHLELAERIYEGVQEDLPHLNSAQWEGLMAELLLVQTARS